MSSSCVEKDKAIIRVFLSDGTFKCFMVTESQTPNAVKFMVSKKLGLEAKEFSHFGLYIQEDGKVSELGDDRPFALHVKWGAKSGDKNKFLFKRTDEPGGAPSTPPQDHHPQHASQPAFVAPKDGVAAYPMNMTGAGAPRPTGYASPTQYLAMDPSRVAMPGLAPSMRETHMQQKLTAADTTKRQNFHRGAIINWINKHLAFHAIHISNLTTDLEDGVALFRLLESVTRKKFKGWHERPDLFGGNENITLAVLLLLIKRYGEVPPRTIGGDGQTAPAPAPILEQTSASAPMTERAPAPLPAPPPQTCAPTARPLPTPPSRPTPSGSIPTASVPPPRPPSGVVPRPPSGQTSESPSPPSPPSTANASATGHLEPAVVAAKPKARARGVAQGGGPSWQSTSPVATSYETSQTTVSAPYNEEYIEEVDLDAAGELDPDVLLQGWLDELDLEVDVPGSVASNARRTIMARRRASTIRNVNTNVFDIDAFDNMEDLLLKMADGL